MYPISQLYDQYLKERARQWAVKLDIAGTEYGMDSLIDFSIENNLTSADDFEIGTAIPSKLVLRLKTTDEIPPNARVMPYVALILPPELDGANVAWQDADIAWQDADFPWQGAITEWLPLGEFFVDRRERIGPETWEFVAYDKLVYADVAYVSQLSYPATMQAVWDEICTQIGYSYDSSVVIGSYTVPVAPTGYTCRQVMGHIAGANGASVYVGKDGMIKFRRYASSDTPVVELTDADYITVKETGPAKTYTKVVVVYDTDEGLAYEAGSGDENHTLYVEIPFGTQAMADALLVQLSGFSFTPIKMDMRGYPQIEAGDRIRYGRPAPALTWGTADVAWQDADFSWDSYYDGGQSLCLNMVYGFKGGLSLSIEAPAKSEQESEFGVDGSLTAAINRLNRNAVKLGKTYYGVTVTADDGLTVERSDHASKVVFNSDDLSWYVGNEKALHYDAQENKLKFSGDIEMLGGTINWSSVNSDPRIDDVEDTANDALDIAQQIANGTYTGGTFISGSQIYSPSIFGGSISIGSGNNIFRADAQGIWAGHANFNDAPFSVDMNGAVKAMNGQFSGTITGATILGGIISGPTISGATVTGGTIQTQPPGFYPRIELSESLNRLNFEASPTSYFRIYPSGGVFVQEILNGTSAFSIAKQASLTSLVSTDNLYLLNSDCAIQMLGNSIYIHAPGGVYVNGTPI